MRTRYNETQNDVSGIRLWPPRRGERSSVLIGAGDMRRSDWPRVTHVIDNWESIIGQL